MEKVIYWWMKSVSSLSLTLAEVESQVPSYKDGRWLGRAGRQVHIVSCCAGTKVQNKAQTHRLRVGSAHRAQAEFY